MKLGVWLVVAVPDEPCVSAMDKALQGMVTETVDGERAWTPWRACVGRGLQCECVRVCVCPHVRRKVKIERCVCVSRMRGRVLDGCACGWVGVRVSLYACHVGPLVRNWSIPLSH